MAKDSSFDVVSQVDMQEMDNAVNQVKKKLISAMISAAATPASSWAKKRLSWQLRMNTSWARF